MRALILDGEWKPRHGYRLTAEETEGRWAREARQVWREPKWELRDVAAPEPRGAQDVLIRVRAAGIAVSTLRMTSTDDEGYVLLPYRMALPVIPGHEFAGEVVEVGAAVTGFSIGDPVAVESLRPCGRCAACVAGHPNSCQVGGFAGFTQDGGLAEYAVVPAARLRSLVDLAASGGYADVHHLGVLSEPAAIAYVGMFQTDRHLRPGMRVAVFGAGPIGQAAVALARCAGAAVVCAFDPSPVRRDLAVALGADVVAPGAADGERSEEVIAEATRGRGADLIVDATGDASAVLPSIQASLAVGGHTLQLGVGGPAAQLSTMSTMVRGAVHSFSMGHLGGFEPVIELQARGRLDLRPMIRRTWALDDALDALADPETRQGGKSLIVMPDRRAE
ncbi:alcohol dehydrogenase catalytic domain-containing protein [Salinibacterium sp. GXW1014]|uniref:alcohol dehydrogenase catalytic domain-containing protein n=1 Tax=Salinibacterium sp. GXW1014 TaxID=3377838 RepID=UPI00383A6AD9